MDDLKVYNRKLSDIEVVATFSGSKSVPVSTPKESLLQHYLLTTSKRHEEIQQKINTLREEKYQIMDTVTAVMVMQDLPEPRPAFILQRGAYDAPGEQVEPGAPEWILPFSKDF